MAFRPVCFLIFVFFLLQTQESFAQEVLPRRTTDPVVLTGAALSELDGGDINDIVAFRYSQEQGWARILMQVDEKDSVTGSRIYGNLQTEDCVNENWCSGLHLLKILTYTDERTFTGGDSNPAFDANDELVFMIKDAGVQAAEIDLPPGVIQDSGIEVEIRDPIDNNVGYVYLFLADERAHASASNSVEPYVNYDFKLVSGDYRRSFSRERGPNPERSTISSAFFEIGFSDRWVKDVLKINLGSGQAVDILDRQKALFAPDNCERHEVTFSLGQGAFIVNKSGPVRAIRSYMGANSGPLTQREHIFYEQQEVVNTWLRVHPIPGIMDFYDYSEAAVGMIYSNNNNPAGVVVDGKRDRLVEGKLDWELLTGDQGTLFMQHIYQTHLSSQGVSSYYLDDKNPAVAQCTGDNYAIGSSGIIIKSPISNTDVRLNEQAPDFRLTRINYFYRPNQQKNIPELQNRNKSNPVQVKVSNFRPQGGYFKVYPNPFAEELFVEVRGKSDISEVSMWNMVGKLLFSEAFPTVERIAINTSTFPAGVYVLQITDNLGEQKKMKLVRHYQ